MTVPDDAKFLGGSQTDAIFNMANLGKFALQTVLDRTRSGVGSDDAPFPELKNSRRAVKVEGKTVRIAKGYADRKKAKGLQGKRDMVGFGVGGHMLENASVRSATAPGVRMAFTASKARVKARANERRTPFFAFSDADTEKIVAEATRQLGAEVQASTAADFLKLLRKLRKVA
jgi:hypothetical protein